MRIPNFKGSVQTDEKTLARYSRDASIFKKTPTTVVVPKDTDDLIALIEYVNGERENGNQNISLTARAAGTDMGGGPLSDSIVISFTEHINKIIEINKEEMTATISPGTYYRDFEKKISKLNLTFPSYPASKNLCAFGGIINNNSAGEKTLKYGQTVEHLESIDVLCSDGCIYTFREFVGEELQNILERDETFFGDLHRKVLKLVKENLEIIKDAKPKVSKNSSGYYLWEVYDEEKESLNLAKLFCGAQGTLGLMTNAKVSLIRKAKYTHTVIVSTNTLKNIPDIVSAILPESPETLEIFDDHTFKLGLKNIFYLISQMKGNKIALFLSLIPNIFNFILKRVLKAVFIAEFTGDTKHEVREQAFKAVENINKIKKKKNEGVENIKVKETADKNVAEKYWAFRRESFNLLRSKIKNLRTAPFIEDIVVHPADFPAFLPEFENILDKHNLIYTIAGHAGDAHLHVIPLMNLKNEKSTEEIENISNEVFALVAKYRGSIAGEHNDGLARTPFTHYMFTPEILNLFKEVKNIFDPLNIFNPNKKINLSWDDVKGFVDHER